jgi:hypothetical protein
MRYDVTKELGTFMKGGNGKDGRGFFSLLR